MFTIPLAQIHALESKEIDKFVVEAMNYLDRNLGDNTAFYGEEAVVSTIRYGIVRAASYDIVAKYDVCLYLRLMFSLLGSDFDRDPLYPQASEILLDSYYPPNDRILSLSRWADEFLTRIFQQESHYFRSVISVTHRNLYTDMPLSANLKDVKHRVLAEMKKAFPGKMSCVGEENTNRLIDIGFLEARTQGLRRMSDIASFIQFMFLFGVGFHRDPRFPRARAIFSDSGATGTEKIADMYVEARGFLKRKLHLLKTHSMIED